MFDGVDSCFRAWLNGRDVGVGKDSRLPAEFEVTHLIGPALAQALEAQEQAATFTLAVQVGAASSPSTRTWRMVHV